MFMEVEKLMIKVGVNSKMNRRICGDIIDAKTKQIFARKFIVQ